MAAIQNKYKGKALKADWIEGQLFICRLDSKHYILEDGGVTCGFCDMCSCGFGENTHIAEAGWIEVEPETVELVEVIK